MGNSLQDQLLKAGLIDEKKIKQAAKGKKKVKQQRKTSAQKASQPPQSTVDDQQAARDRELNRQRQQQQQRKELDAQIRQLVENHRLADTEGELAYNFVFGGKVKRLHVTPEIQKRLTRGQLAIALLDGRFALVPRETGDKIHQRDSERVVLLDPESRNDSADDDPYAGFEVPDDLMW